MNIVRLFIRVVVLIISIIALGSVTLAQDYLQMGIDKIARKDYKSAIENLQKAVEKTPKSTKASFYLGEAYFMDNQFDNAEVSLKKAIDLDDENAQALKRYGDVLYNKGLFRDAIKQYDLAIKFEKRNPDYLLSMGRAMVEIDSIDKAVTTLSLAKEIDPKNPLVYIALGDAYMKMNVAPMAIDNYKQSVELDSNSIDAHIRMGEVYMKLRMYKDGLKAYIRGVLKDSTNTSKLLKVSHLLFYNNIYTTAADFYRKYTNQVDTCYQAYWEYGASLIRINPPNYDLAKKILSKAVKMNKKPVDALRNLAFAYARTNDFKNSVNNFIALSNIDSLDLADMSTLAVSYLGVKDTSKALNLLIKISEIDSRYYPGFDLYQKIAGIYQKLGKNKEAGAFWLKKAESDSSDKKWEFYQYAGQFLNFGKDFDNALAAFNKALILNPEAAILHYYSATVYLSYPKNDSIKQAFREFQTFINESTSKEKEYKAFLESAYKQMADYEFFKEKNYSKSLEHYQKAVKYDDNSYYWLMIAYCYASLAVKDPNLKEEGCKAVDKCLKLTPRNKDAQELKKKLNCWLYDK
jgi:tetratricopeptide (TPR) repeat protein